MEFYSADIEMLMSEWNTLYSAHRCDEVKHRAIGLRIQLGYMSPGLTTRC
jgi:hypothetical protein